MLRRLMPLFLSRLTAALLIVTMTAMGIGAASARGQVTAEGVTLVLCSGGGVVQITLDATGKPTGRSHLCPDLALGLLAAIALPPVLGAGPTPGRAERALPAGTTPRTLLQEAAPRARGPPHPA